MPKKAPRNAFYFFMVDFKAEQMKNGIHYANMKEVAEAADPAWKNARPSVRTKYQDMAKKYKAKIGGPENKFTSTGIPFSEINRQEQEKKNAEEDERKTINDMVHHKTIDKSILQENFYVIDVNSFCKTDSIFLIGEFTILKFNLEKGVQESYHELLNPGYIPIGYGYDVKHGCNEFGLDYPDEDLKKANYMQILAHIIDYLKQDNKNGKTLPPLFTLVDKVMQVQSFISQLCSRASEDHSLFRIYRLDTLFFTLINSLKTLANEGLPKESLAVSLLNKDVFKFNPGLSCEFHEAGEKSVECTSSRVKRWVYTILDRCCPIVGINAKAGSHLPSEYDIQGIINYKQEKKAAAGPSVASIASLSCDSSMLSESFNDSNIASTSHTTTTTIADKKTKRTHTPLRMPRGDHFKAPPAPELTESEFPSLSSTRGRGRGRGISGRFSNMKIEE